MKNNSVNSSNALEVYREKSQMILTSLQDLLFVRACLTYQKDDEIFLIMDTVFDLLNCAYDMRIESGELSITQTEATRLLVGIIVPTLEKADFDVSFMSLDEMRSFSSLGFLHNYLILITNSIYEESLVEEV